MKFEDYFLEPLSFFGRNFNLVIISGLFFFFQFCVVEHRANDAKSLSISIFKKRLSSFIKLFDLMSYKKDS